MLFEKLSKRVKEIIVFGEIIDAVIKSNNSKFNLHITQNLDEAFQCAVSKAKINDTVLFSPSSASYDQFSNYIERGNKFNNKVEEYEMAIKKEIYAYFHAYRLGYANLAYSNGRNSLADLFSNGVERKNLVADSLSAMSEGV